MKKFVTLLLAGMMALSMAACGAPAENNDTKATDEAVATVDQNGLVHALKVGETNIIISNNLDTRTLTYKVIVTG